MKEVSKKLRAFRLIILILAFIGLGIMSYLTYIHYADVESFCDLTEEVSCDVVTTSIYSEIFGIPVSIMGLIFFSIIIFSTFRERKKEIFQTIFILSLFVLIPSLYLTLLEIFVIKSICILCESSKVIMFLILLLSLFAAKSVGKVTWQMATPIIIAGVVVSGITYFAQTSIISQEDHTPLVQCLNEKGVVYYKSVRCSNCRRQEMVLGEAYKKLNSIECHPEGENPMPEFCFEKGISKTPTFLLEDKDGTEMERLEGLQSIEDLALFAGCNIE